jgi:hypothetical protein
MGGWRNKVLPCRDSRFKGIEPGNGCGRNRSGGSGSQAMTGAAEPPKAAGGECDSSHCREFSQGRKSVKGGSLVFSAIVHGSMMVNAVSCDCKPQIVQAISDLPWEQLSYLSFLGRV